MLISLEVARLEQIANAAIELNRLAMLAYSDRRGALTALLALDVPPEISSLSDAVLEHVGVLYRQERKPRTPGKRKAKD